MRRGRARLRLAGLLAGALLGAGPGTRAAEAARGSLTLEPWRVERDLRRFELLDTPALWDALAIRPGMAVLDVGTGTGQFAYAFAERVGARGRVSATDVNASCVAYVREEAARRGLGNAEAVLVRGDGPDGFYGTARFDRIALFHVLLDYEREVELLRALGEALSEGGRLVLLVEQAFPDFSARDFAGDLAALAREIAGEPPGTPFHGAVRESTRAAARRGASAALLEALAADFNAILAQPDFGMAFAEGGSFREDVAFTPAERAFAGWLTIPNNAAAAARGAPGATWVSARRARAINKLLVHQRYRRHLRPGALAAPGLPAAGRAAFARAGLAVVEERPGIVPFEDLLVFARAR